MSESAQQTAPTGREVLRSPGVTAFMVAQFTMTVGVMLQAAALGKHIFDITGKAMAGWLSVEADAAKTQRDLERWIARSRAYVATLPPK